MTPTIVLSAQTREATGNKVRSLRRQGLVPAVVYGHNVPSRNLLVDGRVFEKVYKAAGESTLLDLAVSNGAPIKVLIHDVQHHPLTEALHEVVTGQHHYVSPRMSS